MTNVFILVGKHRGQSTKVTNIPTGTPKKQTGVISRWHHLLRTGCKGWSGQAASATTGKSHLQIQHSQFVELSKSCSSKMTYHILW